MTPPANVPFDEFQEFLKRIQVLRMSAGAMSSLDTVDETLPTNTIGSYDERPTQNVEQSVQPHSAPEILHIRNRNDASDNWDAYTDGITSDANTTWQFDRNTATTSTFQPPMTSIKVTVGIDEDLKMILEMDPSIVDLGGTTVEEPKICGLPPITGGYGFFFFFRLCFGREMIDPHSSEQKYCRLTLRLKI